MSQPAERKTRFAPFVARNAYYRHFAAEEPNIRPLVEQLRAARRDWKEKCRRVDLQFAEEVDQLVTTHLGRYPNVDPVHGIAGLVCKLMGHEPEEAEQEL